jgi:UDP-2,3-diacylglucosamine hydrolase
MRKIFIADAHLRQSADENYRRLLSFLATLPGTTDTLYILGDLFEFWVGYRRLVFPQYAPLIEQLRQLRAAGVELVYFEGNHDFNLGPIFTETLGARVYPGPAELVVDGRRLFICHGDQMNPKDYGYRLLRAILRSPLVRLLPSVLPPVLATRIAQLLDRTCGAPAPEKRRHDPTTVIRAFARERFAAGSDTVVTGHFHAPFHEQLVGGEIVSLGDWITDYSYAELSNGTFTLKTFPPVAD